jgi:predicted esterase
MKILFLFIVLTSAAFAKYDILKVPRSDGSIITAYLKYPEQMNNLSILINISGSKCKSEYNPSDVSDNYSKFMMAQLQVEKYGIDNNFTPDQCGDTYKLKNNIIQRGDDHIAVLKYIERNYNIWNQRIYIIAGSEGTVVAPLLGVSNINVKAMALWAGARGMTMKEEFLLNLRKGNHLCQDTPSTALDYNFKFQEILTHPTSTELWCSSPNKESVNSYQWWNHILFYNPLNDFLNFKGNIFVAHGTRDKMMPIESTYKIQKKFADLFKTNITVKIHQDLDHGCNDSTGNNHCDKVFGEIHEWLLNQIMSDNQLPNGR